MILHGTIELLKMFMEILGKLRSIARLQAGRFESEGFTALFAMLEKELSDEYFASVQTQLTDLKFPAGVLISAELGHGNEGTNYVLRKMLDGQQNWLQRLLDKRPSPYTFHEGVQEAILRVAQRAMYDAPRVGPGPGGSPKGAAKRRA